MTDKAVTRKHHILVEIWQPNARWHALAEDEKRNFLGKIGDAANAARAGGMDLIGWGALDRAVSNPVSQGFCGVFFVDTREDVHALDAAIREAGWYAYFDHANVAAKLRGRDGVAASEALCDLLGVDR